MKENNQLKTKMALLASLRIIFYSIIAILVIFLLIDGVFNDSLAEWLYNKDTILYYYFVAHKSEVINVILIIVFFIVSFFVYRYMNNSLIDVVKALDKVLNNPEEEIKLNNSLSFIERKLNNIRVNLIKSRTREEEAIKKKNDLIMYMAHDLKTPLTSVIGYLTLLNDESELSDSTRDKYLNIALNKSLRLEELTNQFFEITRYNLSEMVIDKNSLNLSILINQLVDESYPSLQEKNLEIKTEMSDNIPYTGDGDKLARAFGNLIRNAVSYSYEDSVIEIIVKDTDEKISIIFKNKTDKIPEYKLEKLFDKFYRVDTSRNSESGGTGLGLAITKDIIELHGGNICVCSDGNYIEFHIELLKY